jgi:nicotinate-nucleotide adenylyltransferase
MDRQLTGAPRVAFFGGSFDPPHLGHLAVARAAQKALGLDTILFAPVGVQPLKAQGSTASFADRLAMTRLTIASEPGFALSLADAPAPSGVPNYTLETLLKLRAELPEGGALFCLMGADSFAGIRHWHRGAEIPFAASLIVAPRPGQPLADLKLTLPAELSIEAAPGQGKAEREGEVRSYLLRNQAGKCAWFYLLPDLEIEISASEIREQVRIQEQMGTAAEAQTSGRTLLPSAVSEYIRVHGLYR